MLLQFEPKPNFMYILPTYFGKKGKCVGWNTILLQN